MTQASTTTRSRAAGTAVPPLSRTPPKRQTSTTTRLRGAGAAVPHKKARGGEAAVRRIKAAATIKGGREAEALEEEADDAGIDDNEVASGRRCCPTTPTTIADAANVDYDEATSGGRHRPPQEGEGWRGRCLHPTIVVETFNKDGVTGEFSLASQDDIATKDDGDEEEEDPEKRTAVPRARQRAAKAHLPTKPKLYSERWSARRLTRGPEARRDDRHRSAAAARAGDDTRSNKD